MPFTKVVVGDNYAGRLLTRLIFALEELAPHVLGKVGVYPMLTIDKRD
jgi:hypothetical protein